MVTLKKMLKRVWQRPSRDVQTKENCQREKKRTQRRSETINVQFSSVSSQGRPGITVNLRNGKHLPFWLYPSNWEVNIVL